MKVKERLKKRDVTSVQYAVSERGLHVKLNGWKEFIIPREQMMLINGKLFDQQIKDNENKPDTPEQTEAGDSEESL